MWIFRYFLLQYNHRWWTYYFKALLIITIKISIWQIHQAQNLHILISFFLTTSYLLFIEIKNTKIWSKMKLSRIDFISNWFHFSESKQNLHINTKLSIFQNWAVWCKIAQILEINKFRHEQGLKTSIFEAFWISIIQQLGKCFEFPTNL